MTSKSCDLDDGRMPFLTIPVLRRARAESDGPWSIFAVVDNAKIPLSQEQIGTVNRLARRALSWDGIEAMQYVDRYLSAEEHRETAGDVLMGFLKEPQPWNGVVVRATQVVPQTCDQCRANLELTGYAFDAVTTGHLQWSWMCVRCFFGVGCGLGVGWGQLYKAAPTEGWLLVKGAKPDSGND